ncbi:MAG: hypothetical protein ACTSRO_09040 [Candidatus Heimdallarchaeaceae archaeon]
MKSDDYEDKKKKKKREEDDSFPFGDPLPWDNMDLHEFMERFLPGFKGSSFGKMIDDMIRNIMKNLENIDSSEFDDLLKRPFVYGFKVGEKHMET